MNSLAKSLTIDHRKLFHIAENLDRESPL